LRDLRNPNIVTFPAGPSVVCDNWTDTAAAVKRRRNGGRALARLLAENVCFDALQSSRKDCRLGKHE
jgi:hypothetical protein